ncbi:MAG: primosomal protein N' [Candidatus Methylomirabilia bacterium]
MIADVVFDLPRDRPFSYRVPPDLSVVVGQRVRARLRGKLRVGLVIACLEETGREVKPLEGVVEPGAILGPAQLGLARWIASQSYSSLGSTCAALLPPAVSRPAAAEFSTPSSGVAREAPPPELLIGSGQEERLLKRAAEEGEARGLLLLAPEVESARAWAERLAQHLRGPVVRLDSGRALAERWRGWMALARGSARVAVGTRSALLAPVPAGAMLILLDEHEPAHRPPGHPRIHSREVVLKRSRQERRAVILTSATPSVESWWQADSGFLIRAEAPPLAWPEVSVVDVRGGLRSNPLSPVLRREIRQALGRGSQVFLLVTRVSSSLACGECGFVFRCSDCGIPLAYSRVRREWPCRLCGHPERAPDTCAHCRGRQLAPLGWGAERVEQVVRQAFPALTVARYDSEALTPAQARQLSRQWRDRAVRLIIGTRPALKALDPGGLRLVGVITPDHLLRLPDFRAGERAFSLLWAAAERLGGRGKLVVQTQHPEHYAIRAVAAQALGDFYKPELRFRAELGYPPFRRLCLLIVRGRHAAQTTRLAQECWRELDRLGGLTVFPPASAGSKARSSRWRIMVRGGGDLPERIRPVLAPLLDRSRARRDMVEVEMDPLELG